MRSPRTQWLPLNLWVRDTLGSFTNIIGSDEAYSLGVISRCSSAALEYVSRMTSMYSQSFGLIRIAQGFDFENTVQSVTRFFKKDPDVPIKNEWHPPIVNIFDNPTPLLQQTSGIKNDGRYTWLSGIIGSSRLYSQIYQLPPNTSGNRLHGHSDIDEMYLVVDGITILDIECWSAHDQTDIVVYPEHHEAAIRGRGLNHGAPLASFFRGDDISKHYYAKYLRNARGQKV